MMNENFYTAHDMARIACNGCKGCHACCEGMGDTVVVNPLDVFRLTKHLGESFDTLLQGKLALHVEDGVILPHIQMTGTKETCVFLDASGRCSIHAFRPGLCRLFPLGRNYTDESFSYFIVEGACPKSNKTKVRISEWLEEPELKKQEAFVAAWHFFLKEVKKSLRLMSDEAQKKQCNLFVLHLFYRQSYDTEGDFYEQFAERLGRIQAVLDTGVQ